MSESKTYSGSCHCGSVRYTVELDLTKPVISCNCSMCGRSGALLTFAPAASFTLTSGEDTLASYHFNKQVIAHLFCNKCGIKPFARAKNQQGQDMVAINVRCLEGVEPDTLALHPFDGRST